MTQIRDELVEVPTLEYRVGVVEREMVAIRVQITKLDIRMNGLGERMDRFEHRLDSLEEILKRNHDQMMGHIDCLVTTVRRLDDERVINHHRVSDLEKRVDILETAK